jgi:hypothetical protein
MRPEHSALFVRRDLLRALDGFDERYNPYGWEDVDLPAPCSCSSARWRCRPAASSSSPPELLDEIRTFAGARPLPTNPGAQTQLEGQNLLRLVISCEQPPAGFASGLEQFTR